MANKYTQDRLSTGGKKWDVLVKNSSQDGDYSWASIDTQLANTTPGAFDKTFGWQAKDYALLALYDPTNRLGIDENGRRPGYIVPGTLSEDRVHTLEFSNIPQNYHTLKIVGNYFQYRGSNPNWLYMKFNTNFQTTTNALYYTRWTYNNAASTVTTQAIDASSLWGIARGYQPDSYNLSQFEINIPGYSIPGTAVGWYGIRSSQETYGPMLGQGWTQGNVSPWNTMNTISFFPSDGYIHPQSFIAIYGIK